MNIQITQGMNYQMTIALIDGDLVAYINAVSAENDPVDIAIARVDNHMQEILASVGTDQYRCFLSGTRNFRKDVNPEYKANRTQPAPIHLQICKEHLVINWKSSVCDGYEADDALGINQTDDTIICSLDKDLLQIPGKHYSWPIIRLGKEVRGKIFREVSEFEGFKTLYKQMLIGDTSDNIFGIDKIGPKKADKLIDPLETKEEVIKAVKDLYVDEDRFHMNLRCLTILREEPEQWG
jgi:5'-3' exonuclease